jgi:uncharacterized protein (TIGR02246 family)
MKRHSRTDSITRTCVSLAFRRAALLILLCLGSCSTGTNPTNVSRLRDDWLRSFRQKDLDAAVAMYADDAAFLPPDGQVIAGRTAIRDLYRTVAATYNSDLTLRSRRSGSSGDLAYDSGDFSETLTTISNGTAQKVAGQYLMEFRRDALGHWKIMEHVWTQVPETHPLEAAAPGGKP